MQLVPGDRAELGAAMWSVFPARDMLGRFLNHKLGINIETIEARRPPAFELYDWVVREFEGEGRLLEFVKLACEFSPGNVAISRMRSKLTLQSGSPDGHYLRTCLLLRKHPFLNRKSLRNHVDELAQAGGARILIVDGPPKSGRSFSRWYINHVCHIQGGRCYPAELKAFIDTAPIVLVRNMARFFGWNANDIPQQHAQATQWAEELGEWVAGRIAEQEETVWLVIDDGCARGLQQSMREFLVYLAEKSTYVDQMRVVLLAYSESLTGSARMMMRTEAISMLTRLDVREFVASYMSLKQTAIDDDALEFLTDRIWDSLPLEDDRKLIELHPIIQVAIAELANV